MDNLGLFLLVGAGLFLLKPKISAEGIEKIKVYEEFKDKPYLDEAGILTIGYGHRIKDGEYFSIITEQEGTALLAKDLKIARDAVNRYAKVSLTPNQFDALASLVYNIGVNAFVSSKLLKLLNSGDYLKAAEAFKDWNKITLNSEKIVSLGLTKRRAKEYKLFLS